MGRPADPIRIRPKPLPAPTKERYLVERGWFGGMRVFLTKGRRMKR